jgi:hypothetical protein
VRVDGRHRLAILCAAGVLASPWPRPWRATRVAVPLIAVVAILVQLPGLVSISAVRDSQAAARRGEMAEAFARADEAVEAEPWAATRYVQRAPARRVRRKAPRGRRGPRAGDRREPTNWRPWILLARVEAERGRVRVALRDFRRARSLRPHSALFPLPSSR